METISRFFRASKQSFFLFGSRGTLKILAPSGKGGIKKEVVC